MASAPIRISVGPHSILSDRHRLFGGCWRIPCGGLSLPRRPLSGGVSFSSRRPPSSTSRKTHEKKKKKAIEEDDVDVDEDPFEALFQQLEEDLKNDELDAGDDDMDEEEEELAELEKELAEAMDDDELVGVLGYSVHEEIEGTEKNEDEVEDENEDLDMPVQLKNWQLRRLAFAIKNGRRKTGIKNLAAELCLDRAVVLKLLRDPPPNLLMLSASLPDQAVSIIPDTTEKSTDMNMEPPPSSPVVKEAPVKQQLPVHVMQSNWIERKRLKKVHMDTLERIYRRTKRPTNAMIDSIVHVTNLPRRRVLKWFEDKRATEGVPDRRIPYQRSSTPSIFST